MRSSPKWTTLSLEPATLSLDPTSATFNNTPVSLKPMMMQLVVFGALVLMLFAVVCRDCDWNPLVAPLRLVIEQGPLGLNSLCIDGAMAAEWLERIHRGDR